MAETYSSFSTSNILNPCISIDCNELEELGINYYNAKWYDPQLGRFITEDPIKDGQNWFIYASHNPLRFIDPTGLEISLADGMDLSFNDPDGSHFEDSPELNEEGNADWDTDKTYAVQHTPWSRSKIGKFFGAKPKILGTVENPTFEEAEDLGLDHLSLDPIVKDLDGNFLSTFRKLQKDDKKMEAGVSAALFGYDAWNDINLVKSIATAFVEGGTKAAMKIVATTSISVSDTKNFVDEDSSDGVASSIPIVGTVMSGMALYDKVIEDIISERAAFEMIRGEE